MRVEFLATVAVETIAAQESFVHVLAGVHVLGNQEAAGSAGGRSLRRLELRKVPASAFQREVVHQIVPKLP